MGRGSRAIRAYSIHDPGHSGGWEIKGLRWSSYIMVDRLLTVPRERVGFTIGHLDDETLLRLNRTLAFMVGVAR